MQADAAGRRRFLLACAGAAALRHAERQAPQDGDWGRLFDECGAQGTLVVADLRGGQERLRVHDEGRAARRVSPASTFKIAHSLIALDAGVVSDEFQVIPWDGVRRELDAWNRDQDLRSAVRNSAAWVFVRFADRIGREAEAAYLRRIPYGNALSSGPMPFWVDGDLAISAREQVDFLRRLHRNALPFSLAHQLIVKDILVNEAGRDWILRAKSGWSGRVGWWVGWVEWPQGPVFFALNIDTPGRLADLPKRETIVRRALRSIAALPPA
jgi:beta-lactamase class D